MLYFFIKGDDAVVIVVIAYLLEVVHDVANYHGELVS